MSEEVSIELVNYVKSKTLSEEVSKDFVESV